MNPNSQTKQPQGFHAENFRRRTRYVLFFLILILAACFITILNINTGTTDISVGRILSILLGADPESTEASIIWKIRLPRVLLAAILGGGLSVSGFLLQTFFGNPIAGPFVLGISSGAKMTVALTMVLFLQYFHGMSSGSLVIAAFVGSLLSTGFILLVARKVHQMSVLLVAGIMIGYICSAITDFVVTFAEDSDVVNLRGWSLGSFSGATWDTVAFSAVLIGICVFITFFFSKPIGALQLGEAYAESLGVNIRRFRIFLILVSSLLSACVTAFAGPISFVGMAVPHLVKQGLKTAKPIVVIPGVFFGGAVFCMFCDLIARTAFAPLELNISTVTSLFGAPVVIYILLSRQKGKANV